MKTTKGNVFPRMNSQIAATFIAMPPKKYQVAEIAVIEVLLVPLKPRKQKIVHEYGTRKPSTPSKVGLPKIHNISDELYTSRFWNRKD